MSLNAVRPPILQLILTRRRPLCLVPLLRRMAGRTRKVNFQPLLFNVAAHSSSSDDIQEEMVPGRNVKLNCPTPIILSSLHSTYLSPALILGWPFVVKVNKSVIHNHSIWVRNIVKVIHYGCWLRGCGCNDTGTILFIVYFCKDDNVEQIYLLPRLWFGLFCGPWLIQHCHWTGRGLRIYKGMDCECGAYPLIVPGTVKHNGGKGWLLQYR